MKKPISFSRVTQRKLKLETAKVTESKTPDISLKTVSKNLTSDILDRFIKYGREFSFDSHCKNSIGLYNQLCNNMNISDKDKDKLNRDIIDAMRYVSDINSVFTKVDLADALEESSKELFREELEILENCDRVLRNDAKLNKRFDIGKVFKENIYRGYKHTVYELCSLIDTYNIPTKAKLNIALENVQYEVFSHYPEGVTSDDIVESVLDYFLTREPIMTDKQYNDYLSVLENNNFIDSKNKNISYVFETNKIYGTSHADKVNFISSCEDEECHDLVSKVTNIKTEKQAGKYIDAAIEKILDEKISKEDSIKALKSVYLLPLIGNVNESFVNYKIEMSGKKADIKSKLTYTDNDKIIRKVLDEGKLINILEFVSEDIHFDSYILDESYIMPDYATLLESKDYANSDDIKDLINQFKASKDKTPSKFRNFLNRVMTKSPENIIDDTPNLFAIVRVMVYLGISAAVPLGPVFAGVLALINKVLTTHLDHKQAVKLLKNLRSERDKIQKKVDKASGDEKKKQEEYLNCLNQCIEKTKSFISKLDDEDENLNGDDNSSDDDFGFGDFDFDDNEFDVEGFDESANIIMSLLESVNDIIENDPIDKIFDKPLDSQILMNISTLVDNCDNSLRDKFYDKLKEYKSKNHIKYDVFESAKIAGIINNKGRNIINMENISEDTKSLINYEAALQLQTIINEGFNLNTIKLAVVNFKKKFRDLKGKEQELWKNIDIATVNLTKAFQRALTSDRREAIIKGSIIPSFSKCIKSAIAVGAIGAFTGPVGAAITAMGMFAVSKRLNHRERMLIYDEIDTELTVVEKQIQLAENEGDMNQYRFLLNYQKKLIREKQRIKYGIHTSGRTIPEIKKRSDV